MRGRSRQVTKKKGKPQQIFLLEEDRINPAADAFEKRFAITHSGKRMLRMVSILLAVCIAAVFLHYDFIHEPVSLSRYISTVQDRFSSFWFLLTGNGDQNAVLLRIVTITCAAVTGAALSVCGGVCQGIYHTPMASPSMLGINSGGMMAAVIYLLIYGEANESYEYYSFEEYNNYLSSLSFYEIYGRQIWMFCGCLLGASLVIFISTRAGKGRVSTVILILSGVLFSSLSNAVVSLAQYYFTYVDSTTDRLFAVMAISMGSFAGVYQPVHLLMYALPVVVCILILIRSAPGLNVLMFGDEEAAALGMKVARFRNNMFLISVLACSFILCFCGNIGFVGLIVPHLARQMAGSDYRRMLPETAFLGAIIMVVTNFFALCTGLSSSMNVVTSVTGSLLTIMFVLRYRRERNADWA